MTHEQDLNLRTLKLGHLVKAEDVTLDDFVKASIGTGVRHVESVLFDAAGGYAMIDIVDDEGVQRTLNVGLALSNDDGTYIMSNAPPPPM